MEDKPKKNKIELKKTFFTQVLALLEYLRSLNLDDSTTTIYNNNVEFRLCLIKSKLHYLKTSISRIFVLYDIFYYLPCKNFLLSIIDDASENAYAIDFITKSLEQAKGLEDYENEVPVVQGQWDELLLTTKEVLKFLYQK